MVLSQRRHSLRGSAVGVVDLEQERYCDSVLLKVTQVSGVQVNRKQRAQLSHTTPVHVGSVSQRFLQSSSFTKRSDPLLVSDTPTMPALSVTLQTQTAESHGVARMRVNMMEMLRRSTIVEKGGKGGTLSFKEKKINKKRNPRNEGA